MINLVVFVLIGVLSAVVTGLARRYALSHHLIDLPNERSSHAVATPRGGGVGIVSAFGAALVILLLTGDLDGFTFVGLLGGGLLVAALGYWDDHRDLSPAVRALGHFVAAGWALVWLGGMPPLDLGVTTWHWGWLGHAVGVIGVVWMINLYNFMDGIDGIAASEAVFVAGAGAFLLLAEGAGDLAWTAAMLTAAGIGFLVWNWPPAKIFMGDVASGFLGFMLAALAIAGAGESDVPLWSWLILLSVFIVDTTITLVRRVLRGERWYLPHRSHGYQHLTIALDSHFKVTFGVLALNLAWLLPWALAAWRYPHYSLAYALAAALPLIALAAYLGAGQEDPLCVRRGWGQQPPEDLDHEQVPGAG